MRRGSLPLFSSPCRSRPLPTGTVRAPASSAANNFEMHPPRSYGWLNRKKRAGIVGVMRTRLTELEVANRMAPLGQAKTRFRYSRLFVAMTSAPSSNLNTSTDTTPS